MTWQRSRGNALTSISRVSLQSFCETCATTMSRCPCVIRWTACMWAWTAHVSTLHWRRTVRIRWYWRSSRRNCTSGSKTWCAVGTWHAHMPHTRRGSSLRLNTLLRRACQTRRVSRTIRTHHRGRHLRLLRARCKLSRAVSSQ